MHSLRPSCATASSATAKTASEMRICRYALVFALLAVASLPLTPSAFGQIQSTISCPAGHSYWDVLSVMMMDPSLASAYHMEGINAAGLPSAYIYTQWDPSQSKLYYTKNPQGNPWDINLYDSNYIYQWVTELDSWDGANHWNDPRSCKKFNNASQTGTSDLSMRWAARCAAPGGANSSIWNPPPTTQPNNTNYLTYVDQELQTKEQNLGYSQLLLEATSTLTVTDHRANPPETFSVTTMPLQYNYSCSVNQNINSCKFREVFDYALDTTVNPIDKVKHSYGWVRWRYYINATKGNKNLAPVWVLSNISTFNHLMAGQVNVNFQCF